jgi:hypothetical protein
MNRIHVDRRAVLSALLVSTVAAAMPLSARLALAQGDPLPSWNDGAYKQSVLNFVAAVTFIEPSARFAQLPLCYASSPMWESGGVADMRFFIPRISRASSDVAISRPSDSAIVLTRATACAEV